MSVEQKTERESFLFITTLDEPGVFVKRCYMRITGSLATAAFLSQAIFWAKKADGEWFSKSRDEWEESVGISRKLYQTARKELVELGFLSERREGIPHKLFFRLNFANIEAALNRLSTSSAMGPMVPNVGSDGTQRKGRSAPTSGTIGPTTIERETNKSTEREKNSLPLGALDGELFQSSSPESEPPNSAAPPKSKGPANSAATQTRDAASRIIEHLRKATGRSFEVKPHNTEPVARLLKKGATEEGIKKMIDRQCAEWENKMFDDVPAKKYLRPATLFAPKKFWAYYEDRELPVSSDAVATPSRPSKRSLWVEKNGLQEEYNRTWSSFTLDGDKERDPEGHARFMWVKNRLEQIRREEIS